jgi:hypothetical protein
VNDGIRRGFFGGLFVAMGLALGGYFVGRSMYDAQVALNTAETKGLAERRVKADRANWKMSYTVKGASRDDIPMLYEEAKNARIAANEIAANAGVKVGGIRSARQGSFIVRDVGEGYGDTAKVDKDVRVVTTTTFYLTE